MPRSQAEVRLAHAVLEGKARNSGMSSSYASEVVNKMHGRKMSSLPNHTKGSKRRSRPSRKFHKIAMKKLMGHFAHGTNP